MRRPGELHERESLFSHGTCRGTDSRAKTPNRRARREVIAATRQCVHRESDRTNEPVVLPVPICRAVKSRWEIGPPPIPLTSASRSRIGRTCPPRLGRRSSGTTAPVVGGNATGGKPLEPGVLCAARARRAHTRKHTSRANSQGSSRVVGPSRNPCFFEREKGFEPSTSTLARRLLRGFNVLQSVSCKLHLN